MPYSSRPQSRVATIAYVPVSAVARVIGRIISAGGRGASMIISRVPCQRWSWIAPPEPKSTDDQTPIRPAPTAASSSRPGSPPARNR